MKIRNSKSSVLGSRAARGIVTLLLCSSLAQADTVLLPPDDDSAFPLVTWEDCYDVGTDVEFIIGADGLRYYRTCDVTHCFRWWSDGGFTESQERHCPREYRLYEFADLAPLDAIAATTATADPLTPFDPALLVDPSMTAGAEDGSVYDVYDSSDATLFDADTTTTTAPDAALFYYP